MKTGSESVNKRLRYRGPVCDHPNFRTWVFAPKTSNTGYTLRKVQICCRSTYKRYELDRRPDTMSYKTGSETGSPTGSARNGTRRWILSHKSSLFSLVGLCYAIRTSQSVLLDAGSLSEFNTVNCKPLLAEFNMAAGKPKVEIVFERLENATRLKRLSLPFRPYRTRFRPCRYCLTSID